MEGGEGGGKESALGRHSSTERRVEAESDGLELSSLTSHRQELLHAGVDTRRANTREEEPIFIFIFTFSTYQSGTCQSTSLGPLVLSSSQCLHSYFFFNLNMVDEDVPKTLAAEPNPDHSTGGGGGGV